MKGLDPAIRVLMLISVGILGLLLTFIILATVIAQPDQVSSTPPPRIYFGSDYYDYSPFILDISKAKADGSYVTSDSFCKKLKLCIIQSWQTGEPCEVDRAMFGTPENLYSPLSEISSGSDGLYEKIISFGYGCEDEELWYIPVEGISSHICDYQEIETRKLKSYGQQAGLSYGNCKIIDGSDDILPFDNSPSEIDESLDEVRVYDGYPIYPASDDDPAYSYIHYSTDNLYSNRTLWNVTKLRNQRYSGAGTYRFMVDGVYVDNNGECRYHLLLCNRPLLGTMDGEPIFELFDIMRKLPMYVLDAMPYYISNRSEYASETLINYGKYVYQFDYPDGYGPQLYYFSEYEIDLRGYEYPVVQIANAIKAGFEVRPDIQWAQPYWQIYTYLPIYGQYEDRTYYALDDYETPWHDAFDAWLESSDIVNRKRMININCGEDEICKEKIRIKIALRLDPEDTDGNDKTTEKVWQSIIIAVVEKP